MVKITDKLNIIKTAKDDIKTAIENKGVTVGDVSISDYASKIDSMEMGADLNEYFNTEIKATSLSNWLRRNYLIKCPDIIIPDNVTSLQEFALYGNGVVAPKIICNGNVTNTKGMYNYCAYKEIDLSGLNLTNVTNMGDMFSNNPYLLSIDLSKHTASPTNISYMFSVCGGITDMDLGGVSGEKLVNVSSAFFGCSALVNFKGLKDVGQAYLTTVSANYSNYKLDFSRCTKLTHESLMNIINNLYDIGSKGVATQQLVLGSTNLAKLTADEIAIATNKGWTVS